ncbi:unnamed protein product [Allacma fusca]|uniref:WH2 domain-containing protein n=1 Tax=Allacma fusca TaxID=39272 RepID=A0A8J2JFC5_9HEXA|nr:unnamed protein product [Allacma fusca]
MKTEGGKYQVKLVPSHCHREETIVEILSALDHLAAISNEIFATIKERISSQQAHVSSLSTRVAATAEQVAALKSTQKGIRIVSAAKYPSSFPEDESKGVLSITFPVLRAKPVPPQKSYINTYNLEALGNMSHLTSSPVKNPSELLQYYHVRDANALNSNVERLESAYESGLGRPSINLNLVDSFLLFNTGENPYQNYHVYEKDTKKNISSRFVKKAEVVEAQDVPTNTRTDQDVEQENDDFFYYPSSVEIPDICVPDQLPDLPGIADSISLATESLNFNSVPTFQRPSSLSLFAASMNSSNLFSPSSASTMTPSPAETFKQSVTPVPEMPQQVKPKVVEPIPSVPTFVPPPPPPPPPPHVPLILPNVPKDSSQPPPPPPPPPPPFSLVDTSKVPEQSLTDSADSAPKNSKKAVKTGATVDPRTNLMAAIREAGGAGILRSVKDRKYEAKIKKQEEKQKEKEGASEGTDMMADLKNTLAMRRRGISGLGEGKRQAGLGDIMDKLAATIPALEDSNEEAFGGTISDDDDWDA